MNQKLSAPSHSRQIYGELRGSILSLDLAPGERLTERGLENRFNTSRTTVRSALLHLVAEGLVQREGRGWCVAPIDLNEIQQLAELRLAVESAATKLAVERASDHEISAVAEMLFDTRPTVNEEESVRAGSDFHIELVRLSGNLLMVETVRGALTRLARTRWLEVRTQSFRESAWQEHRMIIDAVGARDSVTSARLVVQHIEGTNDRLLSFLNFERRRLRGFGLTIVDTSAYQTKSDSSTQRTSAI